MYRRLKMEKANFDWKFYTTHYEDVNYIKNECNAWEHYRKYGIKEGKYPNKNKYEESKLKCRNKMVSIVMTYYNRKQLILETLRGFEKMYTGKYNFEVVIVDDNSNDENRLEYVIKEFSFPINLIVISKEEKGDRINPCVAYNKGFKATKGEIVIIQNPECYHVGNIIKHTIEKLTEQDYFSYSCYSINSQELNDLIFNSTSEIYDEHIKENNIQGFFVKLWSCETDTCTGNNKNFKPFRLEWYNHPKKNPTGYHFCSAIYKSKLDLIGGFDERFKDGFCFDDDEFVLSIKYKLQLNIKIIDPDDNVFVIHQYHNRVNNQFICATLADDDDIKIKWLKNKKIFEEIKTKFS
jgi:glycosyltransferase involved in cell wall biosynthesis